jgi:hypothetical protein
LLPPRDAELGLDGASAGFDELDGGGGGSTGGVVASSAAPLRGSMSIVPRDWLTLSE